MAGRLSCAKMSLAVGKRCAGQAPAGRRVVGQEALPVLRGGAAHGTGGAVAACVRKA
jgi:hypothetical protein